MGVGEGEGEEKEAIYTTNAIARMVRLHSFNEDPKQRSISPALSLGMPYKIRHIAVFYSFLFVKNR